MTVQVAALSGGWQEQARCRAHVLCGENWMGTCWVGTPTRIRCTLGMAGRLGLVWPVESHTFHAGPTSSSK